MKAITKGLAAATVALGLGGTAAAGDYCPPAYKKVVCYETVTTYVTKEVPYEVCVTKYDHCGKPYHAYVTQYRTVRVPVTKTVAVVKYVPAY